jgi:hypothetical protein
MLKKISLYLTAALSLLSFSIAANAITVTTKGDVYINSSGAGYASGCNWATIYSGYQPAPVTLYVEVKGLTCSQTGGTYLVTKSYVNGSCNGGSVSSISGYVSEGSACGTWAIYQAVTKDVVACPHPGQVVYDNVSQSSATTYINAALTYCGQPQNSNCGITVTAITNNTYNPTPPLRIACNSNQY